MTEQVHTREGVVFGRGGSSDLLCDIYAPAGAQDCPAVVLLHGGGWRTGDRSVMRGYGLHLAAAGFVCVASQYRLRPDHDWPAHIHDVKAAIRYVRANAQDLGVDPAKVATLGRSAGGHLALLAAGTPNLEVFEGNGGHDGQDTSVAAVVAVFPPVVFFAGEQRARGGTPAGALLGPGGSAADAAAASPLQYVTPEFPPTFLLHGTDDKVVPPSASIVMYEALVQAGVPVEMHMYAGQPHGFVREPSFSDLTATEIVHFLERQLLGEHVLETPQA